MTDRLHRSIAVRLLAHAAVVLTVLVVALGLGTAPASANRPGGDGGSCSHNCWANYVEFADGPNGHFLYWYHYVKHDTAMHRYYDWGFNGCSVPQWVYKTLGAIKFKSIVTIDPHLDEKAQMYATYFAPSCRLHDFGYRNFGGSPYHVTMGDSSDGRKAVDDRLSHNMHRQCATNPPSIKFVPDKWACDQVAGVFYEGVRKFAAGHWGG